MAILTQDFYTGNPTPVIYPLQQPYTGNPCFRITDKDNNQSERNLMSNYWAEQISIYGQNCNYYVNNFSLLSADNTYGEQPTQVFSPPVPVLMLINLNENAVMLSKFGLVSDDELTAYIHISAFWATFGNGSEPKSGDVFQMTEYGNDRVGGRSGNFYEITQRLDQDASQINALMGHYIWLIKAKRFEYSFEPGLSGAETANAQVFEDTISPTASAADRPYPPLPIADTVARGIFDYSKTDYSNVYGGYG